MELKSIESMIQDRKNSVVGTITYNVSVTCPHCRKGIELNSFPYNDEETDFCDTDDALGLALFGGPNTLSQWENLRIEFTCCHCKEKFFLREFDI